MLKTNITILLSILIYVVASIINFSAYFKGYMPTPFQFSFSILCILLWTLFSFYSGYKKELRYLKFCSLFLGIGLLLFVLGYVTDFFLMGIFSVFIVHGALYGLRYVLGMPSDIFLVILNAFIAYVFILIGFLIGKTCSGRR